MVRRNCREDEEEVIGTAVAMYLGELMGAVEVRAIIKKRTSINQR